MFLLALNPPPLWWLDMNQSEAAASGNWSDVRPRCYGGYSRTNHVDERKQRSHFVEGLVLAGQSSTDADCHVELVRFNKGTDWSNERDGGIGPEMGTCR